MQQSIETQQRLAELRRKVQNDTITKEDLQEAFRLLRADRAAKPMAEAGSKVKKAAGTKVSKQAHQANLLAELEGL